MTKILERFNNGLYDHEADRLFDLYFTAYRSAWRLFDDVLPALRALSDIPMAVVTNGRASEQKAKLHQLGVDGVFRSIWVSEETGVPKPGLHAFLRPCQELGAAPHEVAFVGDHYDIDYQGAQKAGLAAVWLNRSGGTRPGRQVG